MKRLTRRSFLSLAVTAAAGLAGCALPVVSFAPASEEKYRAPVISLDEVDGKQLVRTNEEWRELLSPLQYHVMREAGTERPFTGEYDGFKERGTYHCSACGNPLFSSDKKYDSGTGWPSFWLPVSSSAVIEKFGLLGTEILCSRCEGHLGHVFTDGPQPTGLRYCMNSIALNFAPDS